MLLIALILQSEMELVCLNVGRKYHLGKTSIRHRVIIVFFLVRDLCPHWSSDVPKDQVNDRTIAVCHAKTAVEGKHRYLLLR